MNKCIHIYLIFSKYSLVLFLEREYMYLFLFFKYEEAQKIEKIAD